MGNRNALSSDFRGNTPGSCDLDCTFWACVVRYEWAPSSVQNMPAWQSAGRVPDAQIVTRPMHSRPGVMVSPNTTA